MESSRTRRRHRIVLSRALRRSGSGTACAKCSCFRPTASWTCNTLTNLQGVTLKIDIFNHLFPKRFFDEFINVGDKLGGMEKRVQNISHIMDLDNRFRVMDEFGDYFQIISLPGPPVELIADSQK